MDKDGFRGGHIGRKGEGVVLEGGGSVEKKRKWR